MRQALPDKLMKVEILKRWICGGRMPAVGRVVDLPDDLAAGGIEKGLCRKVDDPAGEQSPGPKAKVKRKKRSG
jgi:hypothetical protein